MARKDPTNWESAEHELLVHIVDRLLKIEARLSVQLGPIDDHEVEKIANELGRIQYDKVQDSLKWAYWSYSDRKFPQFEDFQKDDISD